MKFYRVIIILALVVMCGLGWVKYISDTSTENKTYRLYIQSGDENRKDGLYELAIESYSSAYDVNPSEEICSTIISTYLEWYEGEPVRKVEKGLEKAYKDATSKYPRNVSFWEGYAQLCADTGKYSELISVYDKATAQKISSQSLTDLYRQAYYSVKLTNSTYAYITTGALNSVYTYGDGGSQYGTLKANGNDGISYASFSYVSPAGPGGIVIVKDETGECFGIDPKGKKLARFMADITECRGPGGELLAARLSGREDWCFINYEGEEQFGGYLNAGCFEQGLAPVQLSDGKWAFVDTEGNLREERFEDVLLDESGDFLMDNCLFYKENGKWILKNLNEDPNDVFTCDEIDISRGDLIAFSEGGLWGFVNKKGEVVISPSYEKARSFSGGVGAVCKNGLWGFVDGRGEMVIDPVYSDAGYFDAKGGTCPVKSQEKDSWQLLTWRVSR